MDDASLTLLTLLTDCVLPSRCVLSSAIDSCREMLCVLFCRAMSASDRLESEPSELARRKRKRQSLACYRVSRCVDKQSPAER